ncbi:MAG: hypothetical protein JZU65_05415, partial [Chlorobium sp.]|nr:hypothetical protein [Chlorobium sp.]
TERSMRQSSEDCTCFYCEQKVGEKHTQDCELVCKKVKVRAAIEYYITVPSIWGKEEVEYYRNNVQCADVAIQEIVNISEEKKCLCGIMKFEYVGEESNPYIDEQLDVPLVISSPYIDEKEV